MTMLKIEHTVPLKADKKLTDIAIFLPISGNNLRFMMAKRRSKQIDKSALKERKCLMCQRKFESQGSHNRICQRCTATETYRSGQLPSHY